MEPGQNRHEVGVDELFFSTTDAKGIIEQANSVFVRMSRYGREELVGAPHNIIRHPQMPGGAFRVMWDTLEAGKPFGAYVCNLAKDGSRYDVFATITPLGDGYLSVRTRPCATATWELVHGLYAETLQVEERARAQGANRADAALQGAQHLAGLVQGLGFSSYDEFLLGALPAEVAARESLSEGLPRWPRLAGPLRTMLDASSQIYAGLESRMELLRQLGDLSARLEKGAAELDATMAESTDTADSITAVVGENRGWAPLMMPLQLWRDMGASLATDLSALRESLVELRTSSAQTRFRIALARLHTTCTAMFIDELITDEPGSDQALPSISLLHQALSEGVDEMERQSRHHAELAADASRRIDDAAGLLQIPLDLMAGWREMAEQREIPDSIAALIPKVEAQLTSSRAAIASLKELSAETGTFARTDDAADLRQHLDVLAEAAKEVLF